MGTTLLKNGQIIDGTGGKSFPGHLLIEGDRILDILPNEASTETENTIDAGGCVIAPGFIDMHSHSDWVLPRTDHDEALTCLPEQGITTIVGGNCGFSPAPISEKMRDLLGSTHFTLMNDRSLDYRWNSFAEYLKTVESAAPIVNTAHQVGHASLRLGQADLHRRNLSSEQLRLCLQNLEQALDQGACGLSFGLGYEPGMYAPVEEIEAFCKVAASAGKPVTVHLKALSRISPTYSPFYLKPHNVRALNEIIQVARKTGIALQLSHFIFVGRNTWSTASTCLKKVEEASKNGLDVRFDAFPYTFGNTTIHAFLPYWFLSKAPEAYQNKLLKWLLRLELNLGFLLVGFSLRDFQIMDAAQDQWQEINGHRLLDIARKWNLSPFEAVLRISQQSRGQTVVLLHGYSGETGREEILEEILKHDLCLFETDALTRYGGYPNPSALGTFPKILGCYVRDRNLFSVENAIHRMTAASAMRFGITDRGVLRPGNKADIVIFDPKTVDETPARGAIPAGRPSGIRHVFINGTHVVQNGSYRKPLRAGKVIRA